MRLASESELGKEGKDDEMIMEEIICCGVYEDGIEDD